MKFQFSYILRSRSFHSLCNILVQTDNTPSYFILTDSRFHEIDLLNQEIRPIAVCTKLSKQVERTTTDQSNSRQRVQDSLRDYHLNPSFFFSFSFFLTTSIWRSRHVLFRNFIGLLPTYFPVKQRQHEYHQIHQVHKEMQINARQSPVEKSIQVAESHHFY